MVLKISEKSDDLLALYKMHRNETCAFIIACNPLGELLIAKKNSDWQKQLEEKSISGDLRTLLAMANTLLAIGLVSQVILSLSCL